VRHNLCQVQAGAERVGLKKLPTLLEVGWRMPFNLSEVEGIGKSERRTQAGEVLELVASLAGRSYVGITHLRIHTEGALADHGNDWRAYQCSQVVVGLDSVKVPGVGVVQV
jgi:hypothetical protein